MKGKVEEEEDNGASDGEADYCSGSPLAVWGDGWVFCIGGVGGGGGGRVELWGRRDG